MKKINEEIRRNAEYESIDKEISAKNYKKLLKDPLERYITTQALIVWLAWSENLFSFTEKMQILRQPSFTVYGLETKRKEREVTFNTRRQFLTGDTQLYRFTVSFAGSSETAKDVIATLLKSVEPDDDDTWISEKKRKPKVQTR